MTKDFIVQEKSWAKKSAAVKHILRYSHESNIVKLWDMLKSLVTGVIGKAAGECPIPIDFLVGGLVAINFIFPLILG